METKKVTPPLLEWGVASLALPGQAVSGDLHLVQPFAEGVLVAAVDGLGHGAEAAHAAEVAVAILQAYAHEPVLPLLQRCHEALRATRGAVLTVASFHAPSWTITWGGVGTIEAVLLRADGKARPAREEVLLQGGVVGLQLPPLRGVALPVAPGDTLLLATDGIKSGFADGLRLEDSPQQLADHILARYVKGRDDALVLVARYLGGVP
jgi:serine phosphatase RsbU (regulator of sigma subunit)